MSKRRLPKSFSEFGLAAQTLFPDEYRARQLFADIARTAGPEAAERIFAEVLASARKAAPNSGGAPKGSKRVAAKDLQILTIAKVVLSHDPKAVDREIARKYLFIWERKKK